MTNTKNILAICGSTKKLSTNLNLITAIADISSPYFNITIFDGIDKLPHFNPDLDIDPAPESIINFRKLLKKSDGVLICTPEYAMGVPGSLKNTLDWTVSSSDFSHKPVALITASLSGQKSHAALMETLIVIESKMTQATQLIIPFVKVKVSADGKITDPITLENVQLLLNAFRELIEG